MQAAPALSRLSSLDTAILETIVYSDVFDFPLTTEEVRQRMSFAASIDEVEAALRGEALKQHVSFCGPYVVLHGRDSICSLRDQRREASAALIIAARKYGRRIAGLPFVRTIAVTGSLAASNADVGDDIDYMIVTARGRVWLTRTLVMLVVRWAGLRGITLCPNYLISEDALALPQRDLYTARELRQMLPVAGVSMYQRLLEANAWWKELLPNVDIALHDDSTAADSLLRRGVEWLLSRRLFDHVEAMIMKRKAAELYRGPYPEAVFDESMCKGHFGGWRDRTQRLVRERMSLLLERQT